MITKNKIFTIFLVNILFIIICITLLESNEQTTILVWHIKLIQSTLAIIIYIFFTRPVSEIIPFSWYLNTIIPDYILVHDIILNIKFICLIMLLALHDSYKHHITITNHCFYGKYTKTNGYVVYKTQTELYIA